MSETTAQSATAPATPTIAVPPPQQRAAEPETFSREYVRELREEAKGLRQKADGHKGEAQQAREAAETAKRERDEAVAKATREADEKIAAEKTSAEKRIIRAELKAAAIKAGMVDLDGLQLLDQSAIKLDDKGDVVVPDNFFEDAKKAKPWLFGTVSTSTSSTATQPASGTQAPKKATEMSDEEFAAAMKAKTWRKP